MARSRLKWECHRKGHQPIGDLSSGTQLFPDGNLYEGFICRYCGCVYYELQGVAKNTTAPPIVPVVLGPDGAPTKG